jgi:hypothetical protein
MSNHVSSTFKRIMNIQWEGSYDRIPSRLALMREYLRRAAWWAEALKATPWPFFDIAYEIKRDVRANSTLITQVETHLASKLGLTSSLVVRSCEHALHFAALLDSGAQLPKLPDSVQQPFEPLLVMFERGDGFRIEGSGLIELDSLGLQKGTIQSNHTNEPVVSLARADLDALDASRKF